MSHDLKHKKVIRKYWATIPMLPWLLSDNFLNTFFTDWQQQLKVFHSGNISQVSQMLPTAVYPLLIRKKKKNEKNKFLFALYYRCTWQQSNTANGSKSFWAWSQAMLTFWSATALNWHHLPFTVPIIWKVQWVPAAAK